MITIQAIINAPIQKVWDNFTQPEHICKWNAASDSWHTTKATNDLQVGGKFCYTMAAKDGSFSFDFEATYTEVNAPYGFKSILGDGRYFETQLLETEGGIIIKEIFEPETENSADMQRSGWQSILNHFKNYAEEKITLRFDAMIQAPVEKVFTLMFAEETYSEWAKIFNPTSYCIGDWQKGSLMKFLGTDEEGKAGGMITKVAERIENQCLLLEHIGVIKDGEELLEGPAVDAFKGAREQYYYAAFSADTTALQVVMDSTGEWDEYFMSTWPTALEKIKEICERNS
jgi:uncharacterized protein YndB with AHSA1/START domain